VERRYEERTETNVQLTCRVPARPCRAIMHDLSHTGCRIEVAGANIELGGTALIDIPGGRQLAGRVVWVRGNEAGVRFERPLHGPAAVALGLAEAEPEPAPEPVERIAGGRRRGLLADRLGQLSDARN